jgi:LPPG:FO 2-phospho-L-lactate transferase
VNVVALAGGVGGAKLADGLQRELAAGDLTVVVNTADDLERHGLLVMPDHDTVMYTLAGLANRAWGWGIEGETWAATEMLARYGEETWFRLGDRDLATHVVRHRLIHEGARITEACLALQAALGLPSRVLPMTDSAVRTRVRTPDGWLDFQDYFVRLRQEPDVVEVELVGIAEARPTPEVDRALSAADVVIMCPSNPIVSIGPILAVPGLREAVEGARARGAAVIAVSPIVGGRALKGPADRMLASLGHESSALGVARLYTGLVDVFVVDTVDVALAGAVEQLGTEAVVSDSVMTDERGRARLARRVLDAAIARHRPTR